MNKAHFFDLGGTLLRLTADDQIYVDTNGKVELLPKVKSTLNDLREEAIFIVTNQSGIGSGLISLEDVFNWITQIEEACEISVEDYWACPTLDSPFRKPNPGMIVALADKHFISLADSIFVGDSESDFKAAKKAGIEEIYHSKEFFGKS